MAKQRHVCDQPYTAIQGHYGRAFGSGEPAWITLGEYSQPAEAVESLDYIVRAAPERAYRLAKTCYSAGAAGRYLCVA